MLRSFSSTWTRPAYGLLAVLAAIVLSAAAPSAYAQSSRIRGTITNADQTPIPSVNVLLKEAESGDRVEGTSTNPDGTFRFTNVAPGTYRLVASAVGYKKATANVTVKEGERRSVSLRIRAKEYGLEEVVVSATRSRETQGSLASSVSILDTEDLETQGTVTSDLGDMLAQTVPGLGPSTGSLSNFGQTLRGRSALIMIDGVPQNTPLRDAARSLRTIDSEVIERIEVVRGASSLYGYGATGGAINIITKEPTADFEATTEVGVRGSSADVQESFTGRLGQTVSGTTSGVEYVASGSYERWGQFYDGKENLIAQDPRGQGGLAGADEINLFGKVGGNLTEAQRLTATVSYYSFLQDIEYKRVPGTFGEEATSAERIDEFPGEEDPGTENLVGQLTYEHADVWGSELSVRTYAQSFNTRFGFFDFFPDGGGQPFVQSVKAGGRVDVTTPLGLTEGSQLLWGVDVLRDQTEQTLEDGRTYAPEMTQKSAAPFAQLRIPVGNRLTLRGGARYETMSLDVEGFTRLFAGSEVEGGTLTYDDVAFNAGAVFAVDETFDLFASFKQGFSVNDVGRVLRDRTSISSVDQVSPEPQTVNSYETGMRLGNEQARITLTGFYNTSKFGSEFGDLPELNIQRAPEHVYGVESTMDVQVGDPVSVGGTLAWLRGRKDADDDGSFETYLKSTRIPPAKMTGYVEVSPTDRWSSRLQVIHSGSRDRFDSDSDVFGRGPITGYTLVDLSGTVNVGPGALKLGIQNLFDTYYFPVQSQFTNSGSRYTPGRGRNVSLSYKVTW